MTINWNAKYGLEVARVEFYTFSNWANFGFTLGHNMFGFYFRVSVTFGALKIWKGWITFFYLIWFISFHSYFIRVKLWMIRKWRRIAKCLSFCLGLFLLLPLDYATNIFPVIRNKTKMHQEYIRQKVSSERSVQWATPSQRCWPPTQR